MPLASLAPLVGLVVALGTAALGAGPFPPAPPAPLPPAPLLAEPSSGLRVIVNAENPVVELSRDQVSRFFLKKVTRWSTELRAEPVDLAPTSPLRTAFTQAVHRRSLDAVRVYWRQQIYSARDVPPPDLADEAAVVSYVRAHPGAIGYVSADALLRGVKTVAIVGP